MEKKYIIDYPELMEQWDFDKNNAIGLDPSKTAHKSKKKVWWLCSNGHSYEQSIDKKTVRNYGCPICNNSKIVKGINDLATIRPDVAKEWHPTKNGDLTPFAVSYGSGKRVWWLCPEGHEYQATIHDKTSDNTKCPICNKRNQTSFPEQAIFYYVRQIYPNAINRYTDIFVNSMELDIYIPSIKVAIEYDGAQWHKSESEYKRELKKYSICKENKIYLIRVKEADEWTWKDVADQFYLIKKSKKLQQLELIIRQIVDFVDLESNFWTCKNPMQIHSKIDVNLERDKHKIQSYLTDTANSLEEYDSVLVKEWDYEKNGHLKPSMFAPHSNDIVWWKCIKCGNSFKMGINDRTNRRKSGCPECAKSSRVVSFRKQVVDKIGSLEFTHPHLAKEWHPTKNGDLTPRDISAGHFKPKWWKCGKCGYEWEASPNNRKKGVGCPCCSGRVPMIGVNDLQTVNPTLVEEWNYDKNGNLKPNMFLPKSGKVVWWKCSKCGCEWECSIRERSNGSPCLNCRKTWKKGRKQ